jgi:acetylornithine deacetylase/succinyl-diaminopimelate desuccinylase-like protein
MITCSLKYTIDPRKVAEFEHYGRLWITLVEKFGGIHHGYFLPHEGANDIGLALFSFPSLAEYEEYREKIKHDAECQAAMAYARETRCILRFDRSFMRPALEGITGE